MIIPAGQGCCGALSLHGGRQAEAAGVRPAHDRGVRAGRGGRDRGQLGRLRLGDEGVRRAARRTTAAGRRGRPRCRAQGPRPQRVPRRARPGRAAASAAGHGRLPRRLPPRPRPADHRAAARACCAASPACCWPRSPTAATCCGSAGIYNLVQPEARPGAGRAQGRRGGQHRGAAADRRQPGLHAADLRGAGGTAARCCRWRTSPRSWTRRCAASRWAGCSAVRPDDARLASRRRHGCRQLTSVRGIGSDQAKYRNSKV